MKRISALLLAMLLVLSLAACGGEPEPADPSTLLVGTWKDADGNTMTFKSSYDGTCLVSGFQVSCNWQYIKDSNAFNVDYGSGNQNVTITESNGTYSLQWDGVTFTKR